MYQENYQFKRKGKDKGRRILVILLLILTVLVLLLGYFFFTKNKVKAEESNVLPVEEKIGYTEIIGYGKISLSQDSPSLTLFNPSGNTTSLSYEIEDETGNPLYDSGLIMPGEKENFDAYSELDKGEHTLVYHISIYSEDLDLLNDNITQLQEVEVNKSE